MGIYDVCECARMHLCMCEGAGVCAHACEAPELTWVPASVSLLLLR